MSLVVGKGRLCALLFLNREFSIERDFVVRELFDHSAERRGWQSPEIAEFVEETLQSVRASRHLHVFLQLRSRFGQREELAPIESQHFDRGAATNRRRSRSAFR